MIDGLSVMFVDQVDIEAARNVISVPSKDELAVDWFGTVTWGAMRISFYLLVTVVNPHVQQICEWKVVLCPGIHWNAISRHSRSFR